MKIIDKNNSNYHNNKWEKDGFIIVITKNQNILHCCCWFSRPAENMIYS